MVRPAARATTATKMVELRAVQPSFPFYGTLTMREGTYSHALLAGRGTLVRPELLAQLNLKRRRRAAHRQGDLSDSRRHRHRAGQQPGRVQPRARVSSSTTPTCPRRACSASAAAPTSSCCSRGRRPPIRELGANLDSRVRQPVRPLARLLAEPGPDRREPVAGRELPEPGRAGDPDSGRHRRVQRHARVRGAEDPQHRHPEVRRRHLEPACWPSIWSRSCCWGWPGACWAWCWRPASWPRCPASSAPPPTCCRWTTGSARPRRGRGWRSGCWCRCCSRWCRCSRCARSSRRCCCATTRRAPAASTG